LHECKGGSTDQITYIMYESFLSRRYIECFRISIIDLPTYFSYGKLLFIHSKITEKANSHDQHFFALDNRLSSTFSIKRKCFFLHSNYSHLDDNCLSSSNLHFNLCLVEPLSFRFLDTLSPDSVEIPILKKKTLIPEKSKVNKC